MGGSGGGLADCEVLHSIEAAVEPVSGRLIRVCGLGRASKVGAPGAPARPARLMQSRARPMLERGAGTIDTVTEAARPTVTHTATVMLTGCHLRCRSRAARAQTAADTQSTSDRRHGVGPCAIRCSPFASGYSTYVLQSGQLDSLDAVGSAVHSHCRL